MKPSPFKASLVFNNVYIVAKTLVDFCNGCKSCKNKLAELNGTQFYEMMKMNEINLTNYYFKFMENSGAPFYNFYQYQATEDSYSWKKVGFYNGLNRSINLKYSDLIVNNIGPTECEEVKRWFNFIFSLQFLNQKFAFIN